MARMRGTEERPAGLVEAPDLLDEAEEARVLGVLEALDYREVVMHGQPARRTVRHFGYDYRYESFDLVPTDPLPVALEEVRERCARLAGLTPADLAQTLVTRYPPGATIGWHRDAPAFGPVVVGVSLGAACVLRFQRRVGEERRVYELPLPPRGAYVLGGAARSSWQHSIPPVPALRYSVTFRTLRRRPASTAPAPTAG
jgi:alkylated DNA repair protein (DNA oxidative demethylase)